MVAGSGVEPERATAPAILSTPLTDTVNPLTAKTARVTIYRCYCFKGLTGFVRSYHFINLTNAVTVSREAGRVVGVVNVWNMSAGAYERGRTNPHCHTSFGWCYSVVKVLAGAWSRKWATVPHSGGYAGS